jgi:hypothetical protein
LELATRAPSAPVDALALLATAAAGHEALPRARGFRTRPKPPRLRAGDRSAARFTLNVENLGARTRRSRPLVADMARDRSSDTMLEAGD